ncbi:MAG: 1-acyl-sn-glycerol-3-phosphate acyltransferase, partial [Sphaerochaeta sp.]
MKPISRILHSIYRSVVKLSLQVNYDFQTWQEADLPSGPKLFCSNHFSSSDVHFVTTLMKDPLHVVIGPGFG